MYDYPTQDYILLCACPWNTPLNHPMMVVYDQRVKSGQYRVYNLDSMHPGHPFVTRDSYTGV